MSSVLITTNNNVARNNKFHILGLCCSILCRLGNKSTICIAQEAGCRKARITLIRVSSILHASPHKSGTVNTCCSCCLFDIAGITPIGIEMGNIEKSMNCTQPRNNRPRGVGIFCIIRCLIRCYICGRIIVVGLPTYIRRFSSWKDVVTP